MAKKTFLIILSLLIFIPFPVSAQSNGLVPCGPGVGQGGDPGFDPSIDGIPCTICHFFVLINNILEMIFTEIVPFLVGLMLIVGGIWFYFAGVSEEQKRKAKGIITSSVIGIVIILTAWILVNTIFSQMDIVDTTGAWYEWYKIECNL